MKGRSIVMEDLSCITDMQPSSIAVNVKFIHETAQDAYGHLKEFCKIKAENGRLRTTARQQKSRIANLERQRCALEHALGIVSPSGADRCMLKRNGGSFEACKQCPNFIEPLQKEGLK